MELVIGALFFLFLLWVINRIDRIGHKQYRGDRFATEYQKRFIFQRDGGRCRHCGRKCVRTRRQVRNQANFDHVRPYSWGGPTTLGNLQLLCRECNMKKGARYIGL